MNENYKQRYENALSIITQKLKYFNHSLRGTTIIVKNEKDIERLCKILEINGLEFIINKNEIIVDYKSIENFIKNAFVEKWVIEMSYYSIYENNYSFECEQSAEFFYFDSEEDALLFYYSHFSDNANYFYNYPQKRKIPVVKGLE